MEELIDVVRTAVTSGATTDQKAAGVHACRTIAAALDTEPGKPIVLPGTLPQSPLAGISIDQVLEFLVARLTVVANAREATVSSPAPAPNRLRIPTVVPPRSVARVATGARNTASNRQSAPTRKP